MPRPRRGKLSGAYSRRRAPCAWFRLSQLVGKPARPGFPHARARHGTHFALAARAQSDHSFMPGLTIAEVPSTFAELRLMEQLLAAGGHLGRASLAMTLDAVVVAVFIQAAFARYEQRAYALRAGGQSLTPDRLSDLFDAGARKGLGRRDDGRARRPQDDLGIGASLHLRALLHVRLRLRVPGRRRAAPALTRGRLRREVRTLPRGGGFELTGGLDATRGCRPRDPGIWDEGFAVIESWLEQISL